MITYGIENRQSVMHEKPNTPMNFFIFFRKIGNVTGLRAVADKTHLPIERGERCLSAPVMLSQTKGINLMITFG